MTHTVQLDQPVPAFTATATGELTLTEKDLQGRNTVVYFYPRDNTPGCTTQGQEFRDLYEEFEALNCAVIGVSRDSLRSHERFKEKHNFPFPLIADEEETFCQLFDVIKLKKLYGKEHLGIERSVFLIDSDGVLRHAWRNVKSKGSDEEAIAALKTL